MLSKPINIQMADHMLNNLRVGPAAAIYLILTLVLWKSALFFSCWTMSI